MECRKLHNKELDDHSFSPTIVRVIKPRRMRLAGHVVLMGERRGVCRVWWGNLRERSHVRDPDLDRRIIL